MEITLESLQTVQTRVEYFFVENESQFFIEFWNAYSVQLVQMDTVFPDEDGQIKGTFSMNL